MLENYNRTAGWRIDKAAMKELLRSMQDNKLVDNFFNIHAGAAETVVLF